MKVKDLIKVLEALDQDKEIMCQSYDDIMGYCTFHDPVVSEDTAMRYDYIKETKRGPKHLQGYESKISNWTPDEYTEIVIYRIE